MQLLHEMTDIVAHDARKRDGLGRHDVDVHFARAQRRRDFQSDEARADDAGALSLFGERDDVAAVGGGAEEVHVRFVRAGDRQAHRISSGGEEDRVEGAPRSVAERERLRLRVERGDALHLQLDVLRNRKRQPRRVAGEVVLRQIGPIDRRFGAIHDDRAGVAAAAEHVRARGAGSTRANDGDVM